MRAELTQDIPDRLSIESIGTPDLSEEKLVDTASLSVLTSFTFVGPCA